MKKLVCIFVLVNMLICYSVVEARNGWQGCCSWHGGIAGYCQNGRMVCNDGTLSPSCLCDDPGDWYSNVVPITPSYNTSYRTQKKIFQKDDWRTISLSSSPNDNVDLLTTLNIQNEYEASLVFSIDPGKVKYKSSSNISINNTPYYIIIIVDIPIGHNNMKNWKLEDIYFSKLYYAIDNKEFIQTLICRVKQYYNNIEIIPYVRNFLGFYEELRRGRTIQFKLENKGRYITVNYSLHGFSYVYDKAISHIKSLHR